MTTEILNFSGKLKWAKLFKAETDPWGNTRFKVNFYPKDDVTRKALVKALPKHKMKEDEDGFYFNLSAPEDQPPFVHVDGEAVEGLIGNGSEADIELVVERFTSAKYGEVVRAVLSEVDITNLIEYKPEPQEETKTETKTTSVKPKRPF